jgi:hypothetical protein
MLHQRSELFLIGVDGTGLSPFLAPGASDLRLNDRLMGDLLMDYLLMDYLLGSSNFLPVGGPSFLGQDFRLVVFLVVPYRIHSTVIRT